MSKLFYRINANLEEMYNARVWFTTMLLVIVLDANNFCHQISQLIQLTSPERSVQIKYIEQREESLQQIVSIPREESLPQIISGIYYHDAIHQIYSEQDICFGMKDSIDCERNAMDLYDQRDSKGQMLFNSVKEGFQNILDQLPEFSASIVLSNENWNILDKIFVPIYVQSHVLSATQQFQRYAIVFRNVLASNQHAVVEEVTYNPLVYDENLPWNKKQPAIYGGVVGRSSWQPYAQQGSGSFRPGPLRPALKGAPMDVIHHSKNDTQHAMKDIHVLLLLTGESEYFCSHLDECVKAMMKIPPGEIMGRVHMADRSDKAPAMKGIEALPCRGHNHVCEIAISVDRSSANQLMTTMFSDGPSQLLNMPPAKRFIESTSQNHREESLLQIVSCAYDHSSVVDDATRDENRNPYIQYQWAQTMGIQKVVPCHGIPEAPASPCNQPDYHQWCDPGTMSWIDELFGAPEKSSVSGDATDPQDEAQVPIINNDVPDARVSDDEGSASDKDGDGCAAAESDSEMMDETTKSSPMLHRMRITYRKVTLPVLSMCSDPEDELPRPQLRKRNRAGPAPLRAGGHAKYFRRNSSHVPSVASKGLHSARTLLLAGDECDH